VIARTLGANLAIQAITFVTSVLIARILGPTGRGELALVLLYPQLAAGIALLGVDRAMAVLGGRGDLNRPVATVVKLALLLSIPAMAAGYAVVNWRVGDARLAQLATIYLAYVPAVYFYSLTVFLFNGIGDFVRFNQIRVGFYIVNLALLLIIFAVVPVVPLNWVVSANLASVYGALFLTVWHLRGLKLPRAQGAAAHKNEMRAVLCLAAAFALPVMLTHLSASAYQIVLANRSSVELLGLFVVYFSYTRLLSPAGAAIGSHVFRSGIAQEKQEIAVVFRRSLLVFLVCALPLWLLAGWLIPLVFGQEFVVAGSAVGLLFVSCLFSLSAENLSEYLKGRQKVGADAGGLVIYLVILGILGWGLVPPLGLVGMALAMALGDILRCLYLVSRVSRDTQQALSEFSKLTRRDLAELLQAGKSVLLGLRVWR